MTDKTIGVPLSTSSEDRGDDTIVSIRVNQEDGWKEHRLAPDESMEVSLSNGQTIAIVEVDDE